MDPSHQQHLLVLRLPEELAVKIKQYTRARNTKSATVEPSAFTFSILPTDPTNRPNEFTFALDGKEYPALLMNLPTPVEALKTFDNKVFLKSGDIGQILQVFRREKDRETMKSKLRPVPADVYCPDGLTAPMADIVQRRFDRTRVNETFLNFRYQEVIAEVLDYVNRGSLNAASSSGADGGDGEKRIGGGKKGKKGAAATSFTTAQLTGQPQGPPPAHYESISEEVIDFEEYMLDPRRAGEARTIVLGPGQWDESTLQLLAAHPELLVTKTEEEDDELERLAQQELKKKGRQLVNEQQQSQQQSLSDQQNASSSAETPPQQPSTLRLSLTLKLAQSGEGGFTVVASDGDEGETDQQKRQGRSTAAVDAPSSSPAAAEGEDANQMAVDDADEDEVLEDEAEINEQYEEEGNGQQVAGEEEVEETAQNDEEEDEEDWMKDI